MLFCLYQQNSRLRRVSRNSQMGGGGGGGGGGEAKSESHYRQLILKRKYLYDKVGTYDVYSPIMLSLPILPLTILTPVTW